MTFKDPKRAKQYQHEWYLKNKEKKREQGRRRLLEDPDYNKRYHASHKVEARKKQCEYREKNKEKLQEYWKKQYLRNKERFAREKANAIVNMGGKCSVCGYGFNGDNAAAFDFHHKDPKLKVNSIAHMQHTGKIADEIKKCELICANCHRILHSAEA